MTNRRDVSYILMGFGLGGIFAASMSTIVAGNIRDSLTVQGVKRVDLNDDGREDIIVKNNELNPPIFMQNSEGNYIPLNDYLESTVPYNQMDEERKKIYQTAAEVLRGK